MKLEDEESGTSVLDYGINEAEVNMAIAQEFGGRKLDLSNLPIEVAVRNASSLLLKNLLRYAVMVLVVLIPSILLGVNPFKTLQELIIQKGF